MTVGTSHGAAHVKDNVCSRRSAIAATKPATVFSTIRTGYYLPNKRRPCLPSSFHASSMFREACRKLHQPATLPRPTSRDHLVSQTRGDASPAAIVDSKSFGIASAAVFQRMCTASHHIFCLGLPIPHTQRPEIGLCHDIDSSDAADSRYLR